MNNVKELVMNLVKNNCNPVIKNLITMAEKGDTKGIEEFARNYMEEQGKNFDKEIENFQKNFNLK